MYASSIEEDNSAFLGLEGKRTAMGSQIFDVVISGKINILVFISLSNPK